MLNIAQVGVGYWGPNILRNLVTSKRSTITRVAEMSEERRRYVSGMYPAVKVTGNVEEILDDPGIDAVVIATPVATHFDLAMRALKAGKHILVEKPMAGSAHEVDQIGGLAAEKGLVAMVGHTFLYNEAVRYIKGLIDSGHLGDIHYIYSRRLNLGRIRSDVDALWNFAPHDISIIQYWLGDPTPVSVVKRGVDYIQDGIEDVVFMTIMYPNKIMANIHVSWLDPHKVRTIVIVGTKKMIVYDDMAENKVAIYDKGIDRRAILGKNMDYDNQQFPTFDHRSGDIFLPKINFKEPLRVEIDHFIDCIEKGEKCITDAGHARKVVGILEAKSF